MNRESHIVLVLLFLFFFQLYSTSKFKIKSKTCSVSNHLSNKMLYLKITGYEMGVALLVGLWWFVLRLSSAGGQHASQSFSAPVDHCFSSFLSWVWAGDDCSALKTCVRFHHHFLVARPLWNTACPWCSSSTQRDSRKVLIFLHRQGQDSFFLINGSPMAWASSQHVVYQSLF